jgi:hypothetical protein
MPRKLGIGEHARLLANVECDLVFEDIQYNSLVDSERFCLVSVEKDGKYIFGRPAEGRLNVE